MKKQKSFENYRQEGVLYVVGTPIGNLQDLSLRAKEILSEADLIAAEDTRHTLKLLNAFGIKVRLISYHEHNQKAREPELIGKLTDGLAIALVSDAGMPGISDPGESLIKKATRQGIPVIPVPGPNAALSALVASGLPTQPFVFIGFLPRGKKDRKKELERWQYVSATLIFYEAPHRLFEMLKDVKEVLGDRRVAVCRELTKRHEEWLRGNLSECLQYFQDHKGRGEFTIVIEGADSSEAASKEAETDPEWSSLSIRQHVDQYMEQGLSKKEAISEAAKARSLPKREVYNAYHKSDSSIDR